MRFVALFALLLFASQARSAPPDPFAEPDPVALVKSLRKRADQWWTARQRAAVKCTLCAGSGRVLYRGSVQQCWRCRGGGKLYVKDNWKLLLYDMRSPAFRALPDSRERASEEYLTLDDGRGPRLITSYKIHRIQLVDLTHGVAWVIDNKDTVARPYNWIWSKDPTTEKADWWVYEPRIDGDWPQAREVRADKPAALPTAEAAKIADAIKGAGPLISVQTLESLQETLVLSLAPAADLPPGEMTMERFKARAMAQIRLTGQVVWGDKSRFDALRWVFLAPWRDRFGVVQLRPWLTAEIRQSWFKRIVWNNLDQDERAALFEPAWVEHEGWILWWKA